MQFHQTEMAIIVSFDEVMGTKANAIAVWLRYNDILIDDILLIAFHTLEYITNGTLREFMNVFTTALTVIVTISVVCREPP